MERGRDFLRAQVNTAVAQHKAFLDSLEDHVRQAHDRRFRDLCNRHLPAMQRHQSLLEGYQRTLGGARESTARKTLSMVDGARQDDFLRLTGDVALARLAEDAFKTFRDAGRELGELELARIGEEGERGIDLYMAAASRLMRDMFVENAEEAPLSAIR